MKIETPCREAPSCGRGASLTLAAPKTTIGDGFIAEHIGVMIKKHMSPERETRVSAYRQRSQK